MTTQPGARRFELGRTVITSNALASLLAIDVASALRRHARGDWGELDVEDREANDRALAQGGRLLSSFRASDGRKFWIITEWDRSATTVLLPEDY